MKDTQCAKIMRHMEAHGSITPLEAVNQYGIMRLSARIANLKEDGVPINREMISVPTRNGGSARVARYSLGVME